MIDPISLSSLAHGLGNIAATKDAASAEGAAGASGASQPTFVDVMKDAANTMVSDLKGAEESSFKGIAGKASTREVVDAVMTADRSLQTAIAIRDKLVSAYLDITKMAI